MKKIAPKTKYQFTLPLIGIFIVITLITGVIAVSRKFAKPQDEVYIKMKLSSGLWWAQSNNPGLWLSKSINQGDTEKDIFGNDIATVLYRAYYPSDPMKSPNQYDTYLTFKLAVKKDAGSAKYRYKRSSLAVGSPISIELSSSTVTGFIMDISHTPFEDNHQIKKIILYDQHRYYSDNLYNSIKINDTYFDGNDNAFKTTKKYFGPGLMYFANLNGVIFTNQHLSNKNVYVEAEIKVTEIDGAYFYGEEQRITPGSNLNISTGSQDFTYFTVLSIN